MTTQIVRRTLLNADPIRPGSSWPNWPPGRNASGTGCRMSWEDWSDIADDAGASRAADIVAAIVHSTNPPGKTGQDPARDNPASTR